MQQEPMENTLVKISAFLHRNWAFASTLPHDPRSLTYAIRLNDLESSIYVATLNIKS